MTNDSILSWGSPSGTPSVRGVTDVVAIAPGWLQAIPPSSSSVTFPQCSNVRGRQLLPGQMWIITPALRTSQVVGTAKERCGRAS